MSEDITQPMQRGTNDRRVVGLRERLVRAGTVNLRLDPRDAGSPTLFDDAVEAAVLEFQQNHGLLVDGVVGPETERRLNEAQYVLGDRRLYWDPDGPLRGDDVERLQNNLSLLGLYYGHLTGVFDQKTHYAVVELQQSLGLEPTGVVNTQTIAALARVNKKISDAKAFSLRDYHRLEQATDAIRSQKVVLVPAVFTDNPVIPGGAPHDYSSVAEAITTDIAVRTHELLREVGATPLLVATRPVKDRHGTLIDVHPSIADAVAGSRESIVVVVDCDWNHSPSAHGVAVFYWGDDTSSVTLSPIGQRAATLTLREIVARTGSLDLGTHGRQWGVLRLNSAPTLSIDVGYISNQSELAHLEDPEFRSHLANAIVVGLQRMYLQTSEDMPTGTMSAIDVAREIARRPHAG
ncbi:N-acetylmuramoyl-L-alanine amidase [Kocuria coralli]|uniref:N-acetylmuramoyl-L-alanine amidase n=1 Tax=Kocuria coralli TaxID=1461025 RepID=A0A5J5KYQ7_9MICC|nr:peptidoglycan-binding protein [Kocuria coralli]KAA9394794.1 N-acetylmuramoyl-L-alanine amidase [Kocuria coralli]